MNEEGKLICVCWFQPEQWERLIEISEDREKLHDSYQDWRKDANQTMQQVQESGNKFKKVKINLEELLIWCNEKGILVNGASRAEYAAYVVQQKN